MSQSGSISGGGGSGGGAIDFLTGNVGGAVTEFAGNVFLLGAGPLLVTGTPAAHTLTISDTSRITATLTTNDATPTVLYAYTIPANGAVTLNATICAADSIYTQGVAATYVAGAHNTGAGAIQVGIANISISQDFIVPINITAAVSGATLEIVVTGVAATTINWKAFITVVTT